MTIAEFVLNQMSPKEILELFRNSTSAQNVCKKLGYKSSNKSVWSKIEKIAIECGFNTSEYRKHTKPIKTCLQCNKPLDKWQTKFCSSSCSATYNNKRRPKKEKLISDNRYCLYCGKKLTNHQTKYCSLEHQQKYKYDATVNKWLNGENFVVKGGIIPKFIKKYLIFKYNNKCQKCGWSEINPITGNIPLEIHHIDGNCYNNHLENLQLLCPNCHSITENYKALNKNCKREYAIVHK